MEWDGRNGLPKHMVNFLLKRQNRGVKGGEVGRWFYKEEAKGVGHFLGVVLKLRKLRVSHR